MTTKFYQKMYLSYDFLPTSAGIPLSRFKSITLCREGGTVKIALTLRDENSNPFEMYDEGEKFIKIPCTSEQVREYLTCLRKQRQVEFQKARETRAWSYVCSPYWAYRKYVEDHHVSFAEVHEHSCSWTSKETTEFHPLFSIREKYRGSYIEKYCVFSNPRPGIDVEEYIEFEKPGCTLYIEDRKKPVLHTFVTVWHKGMKKVQSQTGYSESHRTKELSWTEAAELLRKWTAEAERQEQEKTRAEEYQRQEEEYMERWQDMEGMKLGAGENSPVISCQYGGPHVADYIGNYMFPIPKDIKSYTELRSKIDELLDDYYENCE